VVLDETPMRLFVYDYFRLILNLPGLIALVAAALVFSPYGGTWSGRCRKLSQSWNIFAKSRVFTRNIVPRRRTNEINITLGKPSSMKVGLRSALR
jgi:hypothetical protein